MRATSLTSAAALSAGVILLAGLTGAPAGAAWSTAAAVSAAAAHTLSVATTAQAGGGEVDASSPYQLVKTASTSLLQELDAHRDQYRQDPAKLRALVDRLILPHFDSEFAARLVLGRAWRTASADQRQRFVTAFYNSLLNNYGSALLDFTANSMQVLPYRGPANNPYPTIDTRVRKSDGSTVDVNYSLHQTPAGWKVWDVVVEGISYDKSFQEDFSEQIEREGLDAVIARLEHGETPAAIRRTTGS
ncbi:MAG TPA: ABC transporter substrate-binding protein [Steroidobacteraceae bacterium]|nr:ABC transporter substrate-binding protein [Steroidobacteraceae bacterium]